MTRLHLSCDDDDDDVDIVIENWGIHQEKGLGCGWGEGLATGCSTHSTPLIRKGSSPIKILKNGYTNNVSRRSGSSCSDYSKEGDTTKKAKIGITIKVVMIIRMEMMIMMSRRVAKRQRLSSPSRFDDNKRL